MLARRILSLWFPCLAAERVLRQERGLAPGPFAVVADQGNMQVLVSLNAEAEAAGLTPGQALRDARAMCPGLVSRPASPAAEAEFLATLRRWAGKYSPWVGAEPPAALILDITGCAHLFGGETGLMEAVARDCDGLGLTVRAGLADTVGAAWALARFAGVAAVGAHGGDAKGKRRHWTRGGASPGLLPSPAPLARIAPPGAARTALAPLPVAALRLPDDTAAGLTRLGLRRISDILGMPRAGLSRRFGPALVRRLDQALGVEPEPVSPARPPLHFAVRMALPEPIGLEADILAGLDRLLPVLAERLREKGRGARRVRLELGRVDRSAQIVEVGLARPGADPARIRPLLAMKLGEVEPGFGIDRLRLVVTAHEPVLPRQHRGPAGGEAARRGDAAAVEDLMGRIGARLGLEALTRLYPAESHIPEKAAIVMAAAWAAPSVGWARSGLPRPLLIWPSEPVVAPALPALPPEFRWRGRVHAVTGAEGPERIAPEWWLDDPAWRSGQRDYWRVTTSFGERLWLYYAHGAALSPGWFCQGSFG
jgi:protein ImuB